MFLISIVFCLSGVGKSSIPTWLTGVKAGGVHLHRVTGNTLYFNITGNATG